MGITLHEFPVAFFLLNNAFQHGETLFVQGRTLVYNLFTIYIVKEINACSLTNLFDCVNTKRIEEIEMARTVFNQFF